MSCLWMNLDMNVWKCAKVCSGEGYMGDKWLLKEGNWPITESNKDRISILSGNAGFSFEGRSRIPKDMKERERLTGKRERERVAYGWERREGEREREISVWDYQLILNVVHLLSKKSWCSTFGKIISWKKSLNSWQCWTMDSRKLLQPVSILQLSIH